MRKRITLLLACLLCTLWLLPAAPTRASGDPAALYTCGRFRYRLLEDDTAAVTGMTGLSVDMPENVTVPAELDGHPVTRLLGLTDVFGAVDVLEIPDTVTFVSPGLLATLNCSAFRVSPGNPAYESIDGVLFRRADRCLLCCPVQEVDSYRVPEGTEAIADYAFENCLVGTVTIADSVVRIGENPFRSCTSLREIRLSPSHPALAVTDGMLVSLADQRLVCRLADDAASCTVPAGVRVIGKYAFSGSYNLRRVCIPDSVTAVSGSAFADCVELESFVVPASHPELKVVEGVLFSRSGRRLIAYPRGRRETAYAVPEGTAAIGDYAFCITSLSSVSLPEGVTEIGDYAFASCMDLTAVKLPESLAVIGEGAFSGCTELRQIAVPGNVAAIGDRAFHACSSLSGIVLSPGLVSVGAGAFAMCDSLETLAFPDTVRELGGFLFFSCWSLEQVTIPAGVTAIGAGLFDRCEGVSVRAPAGSAAERYCRESGIPVVP